METQQSNQQLNVTMESMEFSKLRRVKFATQIQSMVPPGAAKAWNVNLKTIKPIHARKYKVRMLYHQENIPSHQYISSKLSKPLPVDFGQK